MYSARALLFNKMPKATRSVLKIPRHSPAGDRPTHHRKSLSKDTVTSVIQSLETQFTQNKNENDAAAMKKYMRGQFDFYGIRAPQLKAIAKEVLRDHPSLTIDQSLDLLWRAWQKPQRDFQSFATTYAMNNITVLIGPDLPSCERSLATIKTLITNKSWWDTVDMLACNVVGPMVARHTSVLGLVMDSWVEDDNMWLRRTAILHQLKYKHKTDSDKLFRYCLLRSEEKEFFIQKSIGWALREYGKTDRTGVKKFVTQHRNKLSNLSVREALKHIK